MVKCKYCNKELSSKQRLDTHVESKVCRKYKCDICKITFSTKTKYNNHTKKMCGKIYECNICGFETKHQSSFSRHINKTCKINKIKILTHSDNYNSEYNINSLEELKNLRDSLSSMVKYIELCLEDGEETPELIYKIKNNLKNKEDE